MGKVLFIIKKTLILALVIFLVISEVIFALGGPTIMFGNDHSVLFRIIAHSVCFSIGLACLLTTIFHFSLDSLTDYRYKK